MNNNEGSIWYGLRPWIFGFVWPLLCHAKLLVSECETNGMYAKRASVGNNKKQRRGLLVYSELPSLPSTGSRSNWFRTLLGFKPGLVSRGRTYGIPWADSTLESEVIRQRGEDEVRTFKAKLQFPNLLTWSYYTLFYTDVHKTVIRIWWDRVPQSAVMELLHFIIYWRT
jgi:hypothetical protein